MNHYKKVLAALATTSVLALGAGAAVAQARDVTISIWGVHGPTENYRIDAIKLAVPLLEAEYSVRGEELNITIDAKPFTQWQEFNQAVTLAAEAGAAPGIIVAGHGSIAPWSQSGLIVPIEDYVDLDSWPLNNIYPNLIEIASFQGRVWGIPQDAESRPFYFWRDHMKAIGYSDADLEGLAARVQAGDYTLANVLTDAKAMQDAGVVEEGFGFWPRPTKGGDYWQFYMSFGGEMEDGEGRLLLDKAAMTQFYQFFVDAVELGVTRKNQIGTTWGEWHSVLTSGRAGLWHGGTWQVAEWAGDPYNLDFFGKVGYTLIPGGGDNGRANTLTGPLVYLVTDQGDDTVIAAELITIASEPRINALHAIKSAHLGVSAEMVNIPLYGGDRWAREAATVLLPFATAEPNNVNFGQYFEAMFTGLQAAWTGQKTVAEAIADLETELSASMGDAIVIR